MKPEIAMKYNRRIFPIFKGLGWDPLFYGAIIFLFLTQVKGIDPAKTIYAESLHTLFLLLFQIPANIVVERFGNRKALILGCGLVTLQIAMMVFANNFTYLVIAYSFSAFGYALKKIAQSSMLYDSTKICIGKNSFTNVDASGSSLSYIFNAITSICAGYLFIVNPYIPIILSSLTSMLTILIAYRFEEVEIKKKKETTVLESIQDIKQGFEFILKSKRLRALFLFVAMFLGILGIITTYENSLLKDLHVAPQYFGIISAVFIMVQCFSVNYQDKIHKIFKNKTLAFLSIPMLISFIVVGFVASMNWNYIFVMIIVMIGFFVHHFLRAPYWVLQNKYLTNFTNSNIRAKILSASGIVEGLGRMIIAFLAGLLLEYYSTSQSYIIFGTVGLILILLLLKYMKKKFGLKPEEYDKEDIEYTKS